ncbi:MAG TPA: hypothetical protein VFO62_02185, partial [Candidatus Binatia bacterium]|nr:hypothetical protein [Candidatus Binatia bacterium]
VDLDGAPRPVGGGYDVGAYEAQLLECGDGNVDAGEECGEPGLSCSDSCTQCSGCICAAAAPVCGDALVCGAEQCESDGDCAAGQSCQGCGCVNEATCGSGILLVKPSLKLSANPLRIKARGDLVVPLPWIAVDPSGNGVRIVADHLLEAPRFDREVPGGLGWTTSADGKKWRYRDKTGSADAVTAVLVRDLSAKTPGLVRWSIKAEGGATTLPSPAAVRLTAIVGGAGECGEVVFADPAGAKPRCTGSSERISCR